MTPRERWENWRREGRPTLGSTKPLEVYLYDNAQWDASTAFLAEAKGEPIPAAIVEDLQATVRDLARMVRERKLEGNHG